MTKTDPTYPQKEKTLPQEVKELFAPAASGSAAIAKAIVPAKKAARKTANKTVGKASDKAIGQATAKSTSKGKKPSSTPLPPGEPAETSSEQDLWSQCLAYLQKFLPEQQINTWLRPLHAQLLEDGSGLKIYVASRFKMDYTRSQYSAIISKALEQITGRPFAVLFTVGKAKPVSTIETKPANPVRSVSPRSSASVKKSKVGTDIDHSANPKDMAPLDLSGLEALAASAQPNSSTVSSLLQAVGKSKEKAEKSPKQAHAGNSHHINASLRFDNLVVGSANQMAYTAAMSVASAQANVHYNPLFIYGASGLGKTHMLHAIGNAYLGHKPDAKVLYTHADKFVGDVVKAFRFNSFEEFRQLYYNLDILLIDDVQEFSVGDKAKTLEEFFYLFQTLLSKHSLIVLTSDTFPKELQKIPDRLISRFISGLTVALDPPPMEMRVAILMKKAEEGGFKLPAEVAFFIAKNVQSNVRELEGALRNVHAYAQFQNKGQKISVSTAKEALRDLLSAHKRQITIENIQKTVADYYRLKIADMHSKRRPANIAKPRQIAMYLAKEMTQKSLPEIGAAFGGRDHTTVLHAVKKINGERQNDEQLRHDLHILEQSLKG